MAGPNATLTLPVLVERSQFTGPFAKQYLASPAARQPTPKRVRFLLPGNASQRLKPPEPSVQTSHAAVASLPCISSAELVITTIAFVFLALFLGVGLTVPRGGHPGYCFGGD